MDFENLAIGPENPTYVIAEAGSNHDGDLETALELVDAAAAAGADAVKFQTFRAAEMYVEPSHEESSAGETTMYDAVAAMEMPYDWIPQLHDRCRDHGVDFLSSPFDERSVDELADHVPAFKVASSILSHHRFLEYLAATGKPILASTGAHTLDEVRAAVDVLHEAGASDVALLHCVSTYPTPLDAINVRAVARLAEEFDLPVGLSDHTTEPAVAPCAAVALGGCLVEKHVTLDSSQEGLDHQFALEPDEFERMVTAVRQTERALGPGEIRVSDVEEEWYQSARRTVQATERIARGQRITADVVAIRRSGDHGRGVDPDAYEEVVGAVARRPIPKGEGVTRADIERS